MKTTTLEGWNRDRRSLFGSRILLLLVAGAFTASAFAQGSRTRFENYQAIRTTSKTFGVYSTTSSPPVNTTGFAHAIGVASTSNGRVFLVSADRPGESIGSPPSNLMPVAGLPPGTSYPEPVPGNTIRRPRTASNGLYPMPRASNNSYAKKRGLFQAPRTNFGSKKASRTPTRASNSSWSSSRSSKNGPIRSIGRAIFGKRRH